jgi:hypothetical protein
MHSWRGSKSKDDQWYFGVLCRKCRVPILFAVDRGVESGPVSRPVVLFLTCIEEGCGERADYSNAKIKRFQKVEQK